MNSPRPLYKYLRRKKDGVADLVTKANFLAHLNQEFLKLVPTPVNQHVQLAHLDGQQLHIIADTPAWAAKFRYMGAHLLPTLNKNNQYFQRVKKIIVITRPSSDEALKPKKAFAPRYISAEAKSCLENMADSLDESDLKKSLLRLANRHRNRA